MRVQKAHQVKLYPNKDQIELFEKSFGCQRFVWNYFLQRKNEYYKETGLNLKYVAMSAELKDLKKQYSFLKEINSQSLQITLKNLDTAFDRFFRKISKFPRFKKKGCNTAL